MPQWLRQFLIKVGIIKANPVGKGKAMAFTFENLKKVALDTFENEGKDLFDKILGHYKEVGTDKVELGKKFTNLLMENSKDLIRGDITKEEHDQNVDDLWNAEKADTFATGYEEKKSAIDFLLDGVKVLAKMGGGILGMFTGS